MKDFFDILYKEGNNPLINKKSSIEILVDKLKNLDDFTSYHIISQTLFDFFVCECKLNSKIKYSLKPKTDNKDLQEIFLDETGNTLIFNDNELKAIKPNCSYIYYNDIIDFDSSLHTTPYLKKINIISGFTKLPNNIKLKIDNYYDLFYAKIPENFDIINKYPILKTTKFIYTYQHPIVVGKDTNSYTLFLTEHGEILLKQPGVNLFITEKIQ